MTASEMQALSKRNTRNHKRLRLATVKASTDNKTVSPSNEQIFTAFIALYPPDTDQFWEDLLEHAICIQC